MKITKLRILNCPELDPLKVWSWDNPMIQTIMELMCKSGNWPTIVIIEVDLGDKL